ncbi:Y-family DNA polymerase [Corynebacterium suicordis]|uniref:DNA polymerase Y family protein n=1 Tax=Corynebacterium suicordis DSM 45110 TaxID=1121369 RepID=A0ABR9ZHX4_9CORY|nr:DNA polymerase Y family protein [Corynebacterium suicordis]MBF4552960.1 DNA polymerase Y family protein [Corynebacterium suicordis DSM 45110]MDR6278079.1 protein ImuB [Corynebacterium suicordis]
MSPRVTVLWFPDWPVYSIGKAKGWDLLQPGAVVVEHKINACNAAARKAGVRKGMKQRHALSLCPQLEVAEDDPARQLAVHEDVLTSLEQVAAGVETLRPGLVAFPADSLARYYGGEDQAVELLLDAAVRMQADCLAGTADDVVTAVWAARRGRNIPPGQGPKFIRSLPVEEMVSEPALNGSPDVVRVLRELGVRTLGEFAALPRGDVSARFGAVGAQWHRIAAGEIDRSVSPRRDVPPIEVRHEVDEPIAQTETAAFVARHVAARLHAELFAAGDACLRLAVRAYLSAPAGYSGATMIERMWRCREPLTEEDTAQRVRWQLEGWITRLRQQPRGDSEDWDQPVGVVALELVPVETVPAGSVESALWGGPDEGIRAIRAAAGRAQALIGVHNVLRPVHRGGRAVASRVMTVPYGDEDPEEVSALMTRQWQGELLHPLPSVIGVKAGGMTAPSAAHPAAKVEVRNAQDEPIYVSGRGLLSHEPAYLQWGARRVEITGWAGPWPVDEQWWARGKRYARMQVATADPPGAFLLVSRDTAWRIEASY